MPQVQSDVVWLGLLLLYGWKRCPQKRRHPANFVPPVRTETHMADGNRQEGVFSQRYSPIGCFAAVCCVALQRFLTVWVQKYLLCAAVVFHIQARQWSWIQNKPRYFRTVYDKRRSRGPTYGPALDGTTVPPELQRGELNPPPTTLGQFAMISHTPVLLERRRGAGGGRGVPLTILDCGHY